MDLISYTLDLAHMFQQSSVGSLRRWWLWLEMYVGLLRLLLSSTVSVCLHLWKVCTKQQAKNAARWSCSCLGYKRYTKGPWACFPGSFIFITIHEQWNGLHAAKALILWPCRLLCITSSSQFSHSVSSWCLEGGCGLSNAYIFGQQVLFSALLWEEYHISHRRPAAEPIEQNAAKSSLDNMQWLHE